VQAFKVIGGAIACTPDNIVIIGRNTCEPTRRRRRMIVGTLAALAARHSAMYAKPPAFPSRPVQLVVAAPAGEPSDAFARMLAEDMARILGHPIVIDNKPGAGGGIAAEAVARAAPDGHTLMLSWSE